MRAGLAAVVAGALLGLSLAVDAPARSTAFWGWRYGPISGTVTLTTTSPRLVCAEGARNERRVVQATYRTTFTGRSMRQIRAASDIEYNLAAGGPAGNTEPIDVRLSRSFQETIHVRTIVINDLGEEVCTLSDEPCSGTEIKALRRASNRLNVRMRPGGRVRIYPSLPGGGPFGTCARGAGEPNSTWDVVRLGKVFPLALFNVRRSTLRFAWRGRVRGETERGTPVAGSLDYRAQVGLVRLPGTPRARCRVC